MLYSIQMLLSQTTQILRHSVPWMSWNLFLAIIPLFLSLWLFRWKRGGTVKWWFGAIAFVAFLPNAPYVLTDVVHLPDYIQNYRSIWLITLVILPMFILFILTGIEAYVISLINLGYYLHRQNRQHWILPAEIGLHALSAIGIYLGRFIRFNSWDLVTKPHDVLSTTFDTLTQKQPVVVTVLTFLILTGLYVILKFLTLAVINHHAQNTRQLQRDRM